MLSYNVNYAILMRSEPCGYTDSYGNDVILSFKESINQAKDEFAMWGMFIPNHFDFLYSDVLRDKFKNRSLTKKEWKAAESSLRKYYWEISK